MILSTIRMVIPAEKHHEAMKIIRSIALQANDYPECLTCRTYKDVENDNVLMIQEQWTSEESLGLHVRSSEYRYLLLVMEMAHEQPEVRFDTISGSTGIETIEKLRSLNQMENTTGIITTAGSNRQEEFK